VTHYRHWKWYKTWFIFTHLSYTLFFTVYGSHSFFYQQIRWRHHTRSLEWLLFWRDWKVATLSVCACVCHKAGSNFQTVNSPTQYQSQPLDSVLLIFMLFQIFWQWCLVSLKLKNIIASSLWQIHAHTRKDTRNIK